MLPSRKATAFSVTELLVVIGVISLLCAVATPSFLKISAARERQGAIATTMGILSAARALAISGKREAWVLFRRERDIISLRTMLADSSGVSASGNWICLPGGFRIVDSEESIATQPLPATVVSAAGGSRAAILGGIGFLPSGKISALTRSRGQLSLLMADRAGTEAGPLLLSRATGLASLP